MAVASNAQQPKVAGKSVKCIILDTSPILTDNPSISTLLAKCNKLYTVPAIIDEVKDINARSRLETTILPFLIIRSPKPESIKFVSDFSRRTGDFSVLSKPDIQILALAYELECEFSHGDWRLRKAPGQKGLNGAPPKSKSAVTRDPESAGCSVSDHPAPATSEDSISSNEPLAVSNDDARALTSSVAGDAVDNKAAQDLEGLRITHSSLDDSGVDSNQGETVIPESESDDSEGWITPSNLKRQQAKDENASTAPITEDQSMQVATITGDFAMQNVLLQIGLNLLSSSLQRVKNIKTYILRCHACFEKVKGMTKLHYLFLSDLADAGGADMSKQFCPRCGKPTLTRVSCSTNQKGEFKIHLKRNMQWNHRGDRFSIPKPVSGAANGKVGQGRGGGKGGWGQELILAEDQKEYLRATSGRKGKETDLMDEDYLPGILTGDRARNGGRPKVGAGRNVNSKKRA